MQQNKKANKIRTVAISLCDNDYGNTFKPLLETIYKVIQWREEPTNKEIENLIWKGIDFHYRAFQEHRGATEQEIQRTLKYLGKIKIYFDEEAEKHIQEDDHDSGSWYLEMETGKVYGY